ncbi:MAG: hypothetical protein ACYC7D_01465 [Nitrososphaerales archaeon]
MKFCIFSKDIMVLPVAGELTKGEISNRADPSICVIDHNEQEKKLEIVLQCNTLKGVVKLKNILDSYHAQEKMDLLEGLARLDDDFVTLVYSKKKLYNFGQSPKYDPDLSYQSNTISEKEFDQLFTRAGEIRSEGIEWKIRLGRHDPPELPAIGIAKVAIPRDEGTFKRKLEQIRPLYLAMLRVKTLPDLKKAKKLTLKVKKPMITKIICDNCNDREYGREDYQQSRFCGNCGRRLSFIKVPSGPK